jgi:hypothetical protein
MLSLIIYALELVLAAASLVAGLSGIYDAIASLKAKSLAKTAIHERSGERLEKLVVVASSRDLNDVEMIDAVDLIRSSIGPLSRRQRSRIERGLTQGNRGGERRYVRELILAA